MPEFERVPRLETKLLSSNRRRFPFSSCPWENYSLHRISRYHGRSLQVSLSDLSVVWEDEYGNLMGSRSLKGLPLFDPYLLYDPSAANKIRVVGLKDELGLSVIDRASDYMRQNHLPTERVVELRRLLEIPYKGQLMPAADWKREILNTIDVLTNPANPTEIVSHAEIERYLKDTTFYVAERDYQIGERIIDLTNLNSHLGMYCVVDQEGKIRAPYTKRTPSSADEFRAAVPKLTTQWINRYIRELHKKDVPVDTDEISHLGPVLKEQLSLIADFIEEHPDHRGIVSSGCQFRETLGRAFRWLNIKNQIEYERGTKGHPNPEKFQVNDPKSIKRFLTKYFPRECGQYLARLHLLGLTHEYATDHNWTLAATLVDLDSVYGNPLGGPEISEGNMQEDVFSTASAIIDIFRNTSRSKKSFRVVRLNKVQYTYINYLHQLFGAPEVARMERDATVTFLGSYVKQCLGVKGLVKENQPMVGKIIRIISYGVVSLGLDDQEDTQNIWTEIVREASLTP